MRKICVITGGGSGMGLAAAKIMGKNYYIIICGRNTEKLEAAVNELKAEGIQAEAYPCDVSDLASVEKLASYSKAKGTVAAVIHAAGMSPHMGDAKTILEVNALGTIYINNAFYKVMEEGSCLIDVSSMSAYLTPKMVMPVGIYKYSRNDPEKFMRKMMRRIRFYPEKYQSGIAYGISKNFVIWYAKQDAARFGEIGARVLSVSPGNFDTPMGEIEKEEASAYVKYCAVKRAGRVEEIAGLFSYCVSESAGYLTGVDILCDGGLVASGINVLQKKVV